MLHILRKNLFIILVGIGIVITIILMVNSNQQTPSELITIPSESLATEAEESIEVNHPILVDIKGGVKVPGVYEMEANSRVQDVVAAAGGLTKQAVQNSINLAQKVFDEMVILVPEEGDIEPNAISSSNQNSKIRINYASETEIQQLTGIGPSKAKAIVDYREENGYFRTIEDLLEISGIGEKTLEIIQEQIQVP